MENFVVVFMVITGVVTLVVVGRINFDRQLQQRFQCRTAELRKLAGGLQWKFQEKEVGNAGLRIAGCHMLAMGWNHEVINVMSGESDGVPVTVFDLSYVVPQGKSHRTIIQTVVELPRSIGKQPTFFLRPQRAWWNRPLFESYQDFNFESHPLFSDRYELCGPDEQAVRQLFSAEVMDFYGQQKPLWVECVNSRIVYYREGRELAPPEILRFVAEALHCHRAFDHLAK